ncbi:hypothetical protein KAR91_57730 [Candidatus Pacearchaeota archaeon]|nr:hypothetical protein [Candidatus Pacearchaeota archaeon]
MAGNVNVNVRESEVSMRMSIEIQTIGKEHQVVIKEYIDEADIWHNITRITTSPLLPNIQRVGYWLVKWANLTDDK